jgi:hypothetical protein
MNASRISRFRSFALLLSAAALLSAATADARRAHFPREGVWRGVFNVNGDPLPFQFEIKGKRPGDATLTLAARGSGLVVPSPDCGRSRAR